MIFVCMIKRSDRKGNVRVFIPGLSYQVAGMFRNGWQLSAGIGGNFAPEWVAGMRRNTQPIILFIIPVKNHYLV